MPHQEIYQPLCYKYFIDLFPSLYKKPGVFIFFNKNGDIVYVGKSINLAKRMYQSAIIHWEHIYEVYIIFPKDEKCIGDIHVIASYLKAKFKPKLNTDSRNIGIGTSFRIDFPMPRYMVKIKND